jgi:hypothetical protein
VDRIANKNMTQNTQGCYYTASPRHLIQWVLVLACFLFISLQPQALQAQSPNPYLSDSYLDQYPDELQEQQPEPISSLSEKATITAALSRNREKITDEFESIIVDNKAALESMDIVQLRVDQSVNRILGSNNQGTYIQSQPNELITLVKILDDGLFRYHQLNLAIARQEKDNTTPKNEQTPLYTGTVSQATAVFWKARGAKSADQLNRQVSKDTETELEFFKKNRYSLDNEQSFKRDQVLLLISKLKLNKAKIENLYDELSMLAERPLVPLTELKFSNSKKITVPELAASLDNLWGFVPNLFPETEAVEPEKFNALSTPARCRACRDRAGCDPLRAPGWRSPRLRRLSRARPRRSHGPAHPPERQTRPPRGCIRRLGCCRVSSPRRR